MSFSGLEDHGFFAQLRRLRAVGGSLLLLCVLCEWYADSALAAAAKESNARAASWHDGFLVLKRRALGCLRFDARNHALLELRGTFIRADLVPEEK